jgi:hypothetical protein
MFKDRLTLLKRLQEIKLAEENCSRHLMELRKESIKTASQLSAQVDVDYAQEVYIVETLNFGNRC